MFCPYLHGQLLARLNENYSGTEGSTKQELGALRWMIKVNRSNVLIVTHDGQLGDTAMGFLTHKPQPTVWGQSTPIFPTNLGYTVFSDSEFRLPLDSQAICVTGVTDDTLGVVLDGIDAWNVNPSCHLNPLECRGAAYGIIHNACDQPECDCFPPHVALKASIVVADYSCRRLAEMKYGEGWHVIII